MTGSEPNVNYTVKELLAHIDGKLDAYMASQAQELMRLSSRIASVETAQKTLRVWGLVALFAGGAGGTVLANLIH